MKYNIVSDIPGRMRIRCGKYHLEDNIVRAVEQHFTALPFVDQVAANHYNGSILFLYDHSYRGELLGAVKTLLVNELVPVQPDSQQAGLIQAKREFWNGLFSLAGRKVLRSLLLPCSIRKWVTIYHSLAYIRQGLSQLRRGRLTVEVLDASAITAAILQGNHDTASSVMFLLTISDLIQNYTMQKAKNMLSLSLLLKTEDIWLVKDGKELQIPSAQLRVGDQIIVRTGAMIPVDGQVNDGEATVNQATMTGEPLGVLKKCGSSVFAGTVVEEGSIIIEVRALQNQTRISQIVDMISDSEDLKAGIQGSAERIADKIVPFSFLLSLGVYGLTGNIAKATSVLMVDYSCAIKLATPIAVISAMREATERGILIKGGKYLEALAVADTIVFDKTGTLTNACPKVSKVAACDGFERDEVLRLSACIEEHFPHSIATAIVQQAKEEGLIHAEQHTEVNYVVAHGISTTIFGKKALIGSHHFIFDDEGIPISQEEELAIKDEIAGDSAIYLAIDGQLAGYICISDPPRTEAHDTISALRSTGVEHIIMLTGDADSADRRISEQLGIDRYEAQVLPEDKAILVEELKKEGRRVIMVGDGINDTPALAAADVSISMKEASDIAQQVADITLMHSDLNGLVVARQLAQQVMKRIQNNFGVIVSFNTALLILGLTNVITASASALLHNLSTMGISAASMRPCLPKEDDK